MASEPTLSSLAALAESTQNQSSDPSSLSLDASGSPEETYKMQLRRQHIRALHRVIDESDVVLLVLDARDPEGCRSRLVEEEVRRREAEGKRLVFVLNKIGAFSALFSFLFYPFCFSMLPTSCLVYCARKKKSNLYDV